MSIPWQTLEGFAGAAGVGALAVLAVFLFVDSQSRDFLKTFEHYASTPSWGIIAAIPLLSISYILGLVLIGISEYILTSCLGSISVQQGLVSTSLISGDAEIISHEYLRLINERGMLGGSSIAFIILSIGAICEIRWLPDLRGSIYFLSAGVVSIAIICFLLAISKGNAAKEFVAQIEQSSEQ